MQSLSTFSKRFLKPGSSISKGKPYSKFQLYKSSFSYKLYPKNLFQSVPNFTFSSQTTNIQSGIADLQELASLARENKLEKGALLEYIAYHNNTKSKLIFKDHKFSNEEQEAISEVCTYISTKLASVNKVSQLTDIALFILETVPTGHQSMDNLVDFLSQYQILEIKKTPLLKILKDEKVRRSQNAQKFYLSVVNEIKKYRDDIKSNTYASIFTIAATALSLQGKPNEQILQYLNEDEDFFVKHIHEFDAENVSRLLELYFISTSPNREKVMEKIIQKLESEYMLLNAEQLTSLVAILAKNNYRNKDFWTQLADDCTIKIHEFTIDQLVTVVGAFVEADQGNQNLFEEIEIKLQHSANQINPKYLPSLLNNLVYIGIGVNKTFENLSNLVCENFNNFTMEELSLIVQAFGRSNPLNLPMRDKLEEIVLKRFDEVSAPSLDALITGFTFLEKMKSDLFERFKILVGQALSDKNEKTGVKDSIALASLFSIFRGNIIFEELYPSLTNYFIERLENSTKEDMDFLMNLGGILGAYGKIVKTNLLIRSVAEKFVDFCLNLRETSYEDLDRYQRNSLDMIIIGVRDHL